MTDALKAVVLGACVLLNLAAAGLGGYIVGAKYGPAAFASCPPSYLSVSNEARR